MRLAEIQEIRKIYADSNLIGVLARPGVVLAFADRSPEELAGEHRMTYTCAARIGDDGQAYLGNADATSANWINLNVKPVAKVFLVGGDQKLLDLLAPLEAKPLTDNPVAIERARAEAYEASLNHISMKNAELFSEVYALRLAVEETQTAQFEFQEAFRKRGSLIPWIDSTFAPNNGFVALGQHQLQIEQVLAVNPQGTAGFDLYFDHMRDDVDIDLVARLFYLDDGYQIAEWASNLRGMSGWTHFRLAKALGGGATGLVLGLQIAVSPDASVAGRLLMSDVASIYGADARLNGALLTGQALSYRLWKAPAGMVLSQNYESPFNARRTNVRSLALNWNWTFAETKLLEPLASREAETPGLFSRGSDFVQVHPIHSAVSVVRIPKAVRLAVTEIAAEVTVAHADGPFTQFSLAIVRSDEPDETVQSLDESKLVAFSGWVTAGRNIRSAVSVSVPLGQTGTFDLLLATRVPGSISTDFAWARFQNLRGVWNPEHSFPIAFAPPSAFEPLKLLRDKICERRLRYSDTPTPLVTLACCVHRPADIPNLLRQLVRQNYPQIEILIALNGPIVSQKDCDALRSLLPSAHVWIDKGANLPTVLNRCVEKAKGELFFKIDADDVYGAEFVGDLVRESCITQAAIVGKSCFGTYFPDSSEISLHRSHPFHQYVPQIAGGTMCVRTPLLREIPFDETYNSGSDFKLQVDFSEGGHRVWSADPFNYLHVRVSDEERHTWKGTPRDYKRWPHYRAYSENDRWLFFI